MATIVRFEEILSWKEARELNKKIGKLIDDGRLKNSYKLISQIESSAGSIMDNIAEGFERDGNREFLQFLYIATGSFALAISPLKIISAAPRAPITAISAVGQA